MYDAVHCTSTDIKMWISLMFSFYLQAANYLVNKHSIQLVYWRNSNFIDKIGLLQSVIYLSIASILDKYKHEVQVEV